MLLDSKEPVDQSVSRVPCLNASFLFLRQPGQAHIATCDQLVCLTIRKPSDISHQIDTLSVIRHGLLGLEINKLKGTGCDLEMKAEAHQTRLKLFDTPKLSFG